MGITFNFYMGRLVPVSRNLWGTGRELIIIIINQYLYTRTFEFSLKIL